MARSRGKGGKSLTNGGKGSAKESTAATAAPSILSPELMAELGDDSAGGAMVTQSARNRGKNKKRGRVVSSETRELAATMSKSKARKLKQLEDKKLKDGRRAELYLKLEKNRMSQNQLSLLQSSKTISMNQDTLRSRLKQAVQKAVAGVALSDAAINELESHPGPVADIEDAMALPVGGALAAARKSSGRAAPRVPEGGGEGSKPVVTVNKKGGGSKSLAAAEADDSKRTGSAKAGVGLARDGAAGAAANGVKEKAEAVVVASKKRRHAEEPAAVAPKPTKKRTQVVAAATPKSSDSNSDSSSDSSSDGDDSSEERENVLKPNAPAERLKAAAGAEVTNTATDDKGAAAAAAADTETEGKPSTTSGSSWAAKMMSSMARLSTSGSTPKWGALSSGTAKGSSGKTPGEAMNADGDGHGDAAGTGAVAENVDISEGDADDEANEDKPTTAPSAVVASYPPPPSWLEGNTPAYHAVEKPLPSASGESGYGHPSTGGGGTSLPPRPKRWVPVKRPVALQAARQQLPVCGMEQEIMEAVHENDTVILCGETGSGKSTQVPQFLYEAGYAAHGLIGVTQPRRVAAVGTAERVAVELGTKCGKGGAVAYQIRYDASGVGEKTRVKFMTDGVLLQEITSDLLLRKYSAVLLDEAHERNLNTDVLLGMLSRSIPLRKQVADEEQRAWNMLGEDSKKDAKLPLRPLKLVIMSATLRVTDFTENKALFPVPPPVISATSRQHPVTVHFSKRTELYDYSGETFKKVCKIHQRLPEGGILVFMTGKREILHMCDKLRREFPPPRPAAAGKSRRKKSGGSRCSSSSAKQREAGGAAKQEGGAKEDGAGGDGEEKESGSGETTRDDIDAARQAKSPEGNKGKNKNKNKKPSEGNPVEPEPLQEEKQGGGVDAAKTPKSPEGKGKKTEPSKPVVPEALQEEEQEDGVDAAKTTKSPRGKKGKKKKSPKAVAPETLQEEEQGGDVDTKKAESSQGKGTKRKPGQTEEPVAPKQLREEEESDDVDAKKKKESPKGKKSKSPKGKSAVPEPMQKEEQSDAVDAKKAKSSKGVDKGGGKKTKPRHEEEPLEPGPLQEEEERDGVDAKKKKKSFKSKPAVPEPLQEEEEEQQQKDVVDAKKAKSPKAKGKRTKPSKPVVSEALQEEKQGGVVDAAKKAKSSQGKDKKRKLPHEEEKPVVSEALQDEEQRGDADAAKKDTPNKGKKTRPPRPEEKPRETDREALLYREADDDEEDAARLGDMEEGGADNDDGDDSLDGEEGGGLSSGSEAEEEEEGGAGGKMGSFGDDDDDEGGGGGARQALPPVHVVPLYAMLTAEEQATVFRPPPDGHRLVVVATNVAETSITIPGIAYVVDCGRQKRRVVQRGSGISQFEVGWVSKASADQRAGRAGRTGPGHCYRLYSSALYTQTMEAFAPPEVLTRPLEDVMLQMKAMGVVDVSRFPFPTPPDAVGLRSAAVLLANLGATAGRGSAAASGDSTSGSGEITPVGKALALLPVGARYAKMLLLAVQGGLLAHAAALVAMLTEGDPFVRPDSAVAVKGDGGEEGEGGGGGDDAEEVRRIRAQWLHPTSDALARLKAAGAYAFATSGGTATGGGDFCRENYLHGPTMDRSLQLRRQLSRLVELRFGTEPGWKGCDVAGALRPPSSKQSDALRQVLLSGLLDNVARRAPAGTVKAGSKLFRECAYLSCNEAVTEPLYIKSTSVLFSRDPLELPEWVVYQDIVRGEREGAAAHMTCVTAIEAGWIPALAEGSPLLSFSDPLVSPPPTYDSEETHAVLCRVTPRYGVHGWELPPHLTTLASVAPKNRPDTVFRWFGRLLLEGGVAGCLSELKTKEMLNDPPSLLTRERPTKKVAILVLELRQRGVCSLPALLREWQRDPAYLKGAVEMWVKLGSRQGFEKAWPTAIRTAVAAVGGPSAAAGGRRRGVVADVSAAAGPRSTDEKIGAPPLKRTKA